MLGTKNKYLQNALSGLIFSFVAIVASFVVQKVFIDSLGIDYAGLNSLFTNLVSIFAIVEMGFGTAIVYFLYKPVADNDRHKIKAILGFYKKFFIKMALFIMVVGLGMMLFVDRITNYDSIKESVQLIFGFYLVDIIISYYTIYKKAILIADKRNYIVNYLHAGYFVLMSGLQIAVLLYWQDFYLFLAIKVLSRLIENLLISRSVAKRYDYLSGKASEISKSTKKAIKKKVGALFFHKSAGFVVKGTDAYLVASFLGLGVAGLYANYALIFIAALNIVVQVFGAMTSSVGHAILEKNQQKNQKLFKKMQQINFVLASTIAIGYYFLVSPFVLLWLGQGFELDNLVVLALAINLFISLMRLTYSTFKDAAGIFYEDRFVPIFESIINIVASIIFIHFFGLIGVVLGTVVSNLVLFAYSYPKYVYKLILGGSYPKYVLEIVYYVIGFVVMFGLSYFVLPMVSIPNLLLEIVAKGLIICGVSLVAFGLLVKSRPRLNG